MITQIHTVSGSLNVATTNMNRWLRENTSIIVDTLTLDQSEDGHTTFALLYKETFAPPMSTEEIVNVLTLQIEHACGGLDIENATSLYTLNGVVYAGSQHDHVEISREPQVLNLVEAMLILNGRRDMVNVSWTEDNEPCYLGMGSSHYLYPQDDTTDPLPTSDTAPFA